MDGRYYNNENSGRVPASGARPALYVYPGEICSKRKKKSQIYSVYKSVKPQGDDRGAKGTPLRRDGAARRSSARGGSETRTRRGETGAKAYNVRYQSASGGAKAETAGKRKILIESIINLFGTTEERRRSDMEDAKRKVLSRRKAVEHRRGFILALLVLAVFAIILLTIYKFFFVVRGISVEGTSVYTSEEIISASGVSNGVNLYSFRSSVANKNITFYCPYIESVNVNRKVPNGVLFAVKEDVPTYYADIYGEYKILSDGLRVLETVSGDDERLAGLIKLKLPSISYSVTGRVIEFSNAKDERSVRDVIKAASSSLLAGRVTLLDLRNTYETSAAVDGKFLLKLGHANDLDLKFKTAAHVLEDEMFSTGNKAVLDLTNTEKTSAIIDNNIETE